VRKTIGASVLVALAAGIILVAATAGTSSQSPLVARQTYHDRPPGDSLPPTLDPETFRDNPVAFVAYTLAAEVRVTLYQVPCYCGCDKGQGHQSLLDCFTGKHGVMCHVCQKEAIFCFLQTRKGKTPMEIREDMAKGKASKINIAKYVKRFYPEGR
jgi:hypothetical protein